MCLLAVHIIFYNIIIVNHTFVRFTFKIVDCRWRNLLVATGCYFLSKKIIILFLNKYQYELYISVKRTATTNICLRIRFTCRRQTTMLHSIHSMLAIRSTPTLASMAQQSMRWLVVVVVVCCCACVLFNPYDFALTTRLVVLVVVIVILKISQHDSSSSSCRHNAWCCHE